MEKNGSAICVILSLLFFAFSMFINQFSQNPQRVADRTGRRVEARAELLDAYIEEALTTNHSQWMQMDLPDEMVIYRYVYDTLQSWCNQFPLTNDDVVSRAVVQRLSNLRTGLTSPLSTVTEEVKFMNLGPKWYLVKSVTGDMACRVIAGLEILDAQAEGGGSSATGASYLRIPKNYSITTLDDSGGIPVYVGGDPRFKLTQEVSPVSGAEVNSVLRWVALLLVAIASILYLRQHRRLRNYLGCMLVLLGAAVIAYLWGRQAQGIFDFFSPTVYADGAFMYSIGALVIVDVTVILLVVCTYISRLVIYRRVLGRKWKTAVYGVILLAEIAVLAFYSFVSLHSLIMNSNIPWELYLWTSISWYTVVTYAIYAVMLFCILLLIQMFAPVAGSLFGRRYNVFTRVGVVVFAIVCALYFTSVSAALGFRKELNRVAVISNRLVIDRDLPLEINLRSIEESIAADPLISSLAHVDQSDYIILNRLTETYLSRISQNYDITVTVCANNDANCFSQYQSRLLNSSQIADRSRFVYTYDANGRSGYLGMFIYYSTEKGLARVLVDIETKANREDRGYYSLLGKFSKPGNVEIPSVYSYAKYVSGRLTRYRGDYSYATVVQEKDEENISSGAPYVREGKYIHFMNRVDVDEIIIVSRRVHSLGLYFVTFSYLLMLNLLMLTPLWRRKRKKGEEAFRRNYYRSRINAVLILALFITLVVMTTLSVTFVFRRNDTNLRGIMSEKISSIQSILETQCRSVTDITEVNSRDLAIVLESIGTDMKADITVFSPLGKMVCSTTPEIFDRMKIGTRIDEDAYYNVKYRKQRFYINREQIDGNRFYSMYAPVVNARGEDVAIVCVPFAEQNINFRDEAVFHTISFINIFLILMIITLLICTAIVDNMFKPLVELGKKINSADLNGPEYIIYKREDEVSSLVDAYNRMVHDLYESMKQVTQTERDKAWSDMARQVAHEIKNPLTPIKLELQRLIRLKEKNDPSWSEKFDRVSAIVLEHIDILTDTANEFSTFAKLYSEEPVALDLDKALKDQVVIFDNKEAINMSYIGLEGAVVMAPRPQLIRVFVNLITNAIQAVESVQNDQREAGVEVSRGRIMISLRNGVEDGYYDIVFEDNGPGVKDENQSKLFTPNFTTKSAGTGLGLAICRNIVEKCNGRIFYQRSFNLGGACFVVSLPKPVTDVKPDKKVRG